MLSLSNLICSHWVWIEPCTAKPPPPFPVRAVSLGHSLAKPLSISWISLASLGFAFQALCPLQSINVSSGCWTVGAWWRCASTATSPRDATQTPQSCQQPCPGGMPGCPCVLQSSQAARGFPPWSQGMLCKILASNLWPHAPGTDLRPWHEHNDMMLGGTRCLGSRWPTCAA